MQLMRHSENNTNRTEDRMISFLDWKRRLETDAEQWLHDRDQRSFEEHSRIRLARRTAPKAQVPE
jgi:hypothetical protein